MARSLLEQAADRPPLTRQARPVRQTNPGGQEPITGNPLLEGPYWIRLYENAGQIVGIAIVRQPGKQGCRTLHRVNFGWYQAWPAPATLRFPAQDQGTASGQ